MSAQGERANGSAFLVLGFGSTASGRKKPRRDQRFEVVKGQMTESVLKEIERLIEPVLAEMGIELVDMEFSSEQNRRILRIYADRPTGINLDDCAMVSREIGNLLDVKDLLQNRFVLEVSSPGLNRPLKRKKDFLRVIGQKIKVKTAVPLKGCRNFTGVLQSFESGTLQLKLDDTVVLISEGDVKKANLVFDFED